MENSVWSCKDGYGDWVHVEPAYDGRRGVLLISVAAEDGVFLSFEDIVDLRKFLKRALKDATSRGVV